MLSESRSIFAIKTSHFDFRYREGMRATRRVPPLSTALPRKPAITILQRSFPIRAPIATPINAG
jgi:hypothetical protein